MNTIHSSAVSKRGASRRVAGSAPRAHRTDAGVRRVAFCAFCAVALSMGLAAYASASRFDPPAALEGQSGFEIADPAAADDGSVPAASAVFHAGRSLPDAPAAPTF